MGLTIYYSGKTKDLDKIRKIVEYVAFTAKNLGWEVIPIEEEGYVRDVIIRDEKGNVVSTSKYFVDKKTYERMKYAGGRPSKRIGVIVNPPYKVESFSVLFFRDNDEWIWQDSTKTQVWTEKDLPNLVAHQIIANMLTTIKKTWLPDLEITDEGEYYVPLCKEDRIKYAEKRKLPPEYREQFINMEPFNFERLIENQLRYSRIIGALASALAEALPPGFGIETQTFKLEKEKKNNDTLNTKK